MNIVITGASRGIGYFTALYFSKMAGHTIFALSRDEKGLRKLIEASGSDNIVSIPCDISNEKSIKEVVQKITDTVSEVDVLINNAGQLINRPFLELSSADWLTVYNVNVFGVINLTRELIPLLSKGKISPQSNIKSHIVNISSMGGVQGSIKFNGLSAYSSSKGALITITECLSEELKDTGIRINCIALGSVDTEMFQNAFPGKKAATEVMEIASWIGEFAMNGQRFFNGKIIPVSNSTP